MSAAMPSAAPRPPTTPDEARRALVARIEATLDDLAEAVDAAAELSALGPERHAPRLSRLASDSEAAPAARAAAGIALGASAPADSRWLALVARAALSDGAPELAAALTEAPTDLAHVESARATLDVSAAALYAPLAAQPDLARLHASLVAPLAAERSLAALVALEALRDETPSPEAADLARAAARAAWATRPDAAQGTCWLTTCDGEGRFVIAAVTPQAVGSLLLTVSGELVDGALARTPAAPDDELARQLAAVPGAAPTPAPAAVVAHLAFPATRAGRPAPAQRAALSLLERLAAAGPGAAPPAPTRRRGRPSLADIAALLARSPTAGWPTAPSPPMAPLLAAMADHMALWGALAGRPDDTRQWTTLAHAARRSPDDHPLAAALSARAAAAEAPFPTDPALRRRLRDRFSLDVTVPTARDLARLDFAEAAALALHLPDDALALAWALGKAYANHHLTTPRSPEAARRLARHAADLLGPDRAERAPHLHAALERFEAAACAGCTIACARHPRAEVGQAFGADEHPAGRPAASPSPPG